MRWLGVGNLKDLHTNSHTHHLKKSATTSTEHVAGREGKAQGTWRDQR